MLLSNNRNLQTSREPPNFQGRKLLGLQGIRGILNKIQLWPPSYPFIFGQLPPCPSSSGPQPCTLGFSQGSTVSTPHTTDGPRPTTYNPPGSTPRRLPVWRPPACRDWRLSVFFFRWAVLGLLFFVKRNYLLDPKSPWKICGKNEGILHPPTKGCLKHP